MKLSEAILDDKGRAAMLAYNEALSALARADETDAEQRTVDAVSALGVAYDATRDERLADALGGESPDRRDLRQVVCMICADMPVWPYLSPETREALIGAMERAVKKAKGGLE